MGTWGTQPKDNDTSWDLWGICSDAAAKVAEMAFLILNPSSWQKFERAGMVQILLEAGVMLSPYMVEEAASDLRELALDVNWLKEWSKNPRKDILFIADAMEKLLPEKPKKNRCASLRWRAPLVIANKGWPSKKQASRTGLVEKLRRKK